MTARLVSFGTHRPKPSKFRNVPTVIDGITFHSKREGARYKALKLLESAGRIRDLRLQVKYPCIVEQVERVLVCTYIADFVYDELVKGAWVPVVEDVKGFANDRWPMKKKLVRACHGIEIRET